MAKIILPYKVNNRLSELIEQRAKQNKKSIGETEAELARYCGLTVKEVNGQEIADSVKQYKYGRVDPSLPVSLKIAEFFEISVEDIWSLSDEIKTKEDKINTTKGEINYNWQYNGTL